MPSTKLITRRTLMIVAAVVALLGTGGGVYAATLGPSFKLEVTNGRTAFTAGSSAATASTSTGSAGTGAR
jgi:hypothetical protein